MTDKTWNFHADEIAADREATYTTEQRAASYLRGAIESLDPASYLDFLPAPTPEQMRAEAIRLAKQAIAILES
jgi:hypothetical protein